jgi:hypothetical protein
MVRHNVAFVTCGSGPSENMQARLTAYKNGVGKKRRFRPALRRLRRFFASSFFYRETSGRLRRLFPIPFFIYEQWRTNN